MRSTTGSVLWDLAGRSVSGFERRSTTRRTVLWVVPQSAAAARYEPRSWYAVRMSNCSLALFTMGVPRGFG
jgi:hypothetical protein